MQTHLSKFPKLAQYDGRGNLTESTVVAGNKTLVSTFAYDSRGNVVAARAPERGETRTEYDAGGRPVMQWAPGRLGQVSYTYDAADRVTAVTDEGENPQAYTFTYRPGDGLLTDETGSVLGGPSWSRHYNYYSDTRLPMDVTETFRPGVGVFGRWWILT